MNAAEIIDSVARAMHGNRYEWLRPEFAERRDEYREWAKTAILATFDAIREPSEAMIAAGSPYLTLTGTWRAMIDALKREIAG